MLKKTFALIKAFVFRYRSFNKKSVKDFAEKFNRLNVNKIQGRKTPEKIETLVSSLIKQGLTHISIKPYSLMEYDDNIKVYKALIKNPSKFTYLVALGQLYMKLTEDRKDHTKESIMVLKFFGYIRFNKKNVTEEDILNAYEHYKYVRDIKKGNVLTDIPEDRFNAAFIRASKSIRDIAIITNKDSFVNKFGNELYSYKVSVSNDRHLNIFLPICENGFYHIGTNIIHLRKYRVDYFNSQIRRELNNIRNLALAYPDLQAKVLEEVFQRNIINVFFEKTLIKPTKREVDEALRYEIVSRDQLTDLLTREVVNTIIGHRSMPASKAKKQMTLLELQMDKGIISESPISTAIKLIKGRGRKGFSYYPHFPLTNEMVKDYDFSIGKTAGETIYRYLDENTKIPWSLYTGVNALYDRKAKRTHLMANQQIKAFKMNQVDKPITVFASLPENVELDIPVVNTFTVFDSTINEGGKTTSADVNLVSPEVARLYGIKNNHKSVFDGLGKNTNRILKNNYYFYLNGKKHYVIFSNPASIHSRENFGILIAGLYNMKKFEDGSVKDTEVRDVLANPIREDELAGMKDIYYEENGVEKFYARRFVGLNSQYFVDKAQSGFDEIILGDEVRNRLVLMRANNLITELYGDFDNSLLRAQKAERDFPGNAYGKKGLATREFYAKVKGIHTTATLNIDLAEDEIRININSRDFAKFLKMFDFCVRTRSEYWDLFKKGKLKMKGLKLRFPHMDDAGLMSVTAIFNKIKDEDPFYETAYIETNTRPWIRMGGDADGDLIYFVPLSDSASSEAKKLLSYENFKQVSNIQDTDWVLSNGVDENYTDLQGLLDFIAKVKRRDLNAKGNKVADILKPMSMTELKSKLGVSLFTTRASKDMIGKAKAPTMKMLGQFTTQFIRGESIGNSYADETLKDIRETANDLNNYYGQNAIDIDKWGDNIRAVWETILEIEFLNILMTLLLDPNVLVTNSFIPQVKNLIPMRYHKVKDSNLEETIEKLEAEIRNHTIDPKKDIFKYIDYELLKFMINHSTNLKRLYEPEILDGYPTGFMVIKNTGMNPTITDKKMNDILNIVKTKVTKLAKDLTETVLADYSDDLIFTYKDEESE